MTEPQFCTFRIHDFIFGIDIQAVQEIIQQNSITPVPLAAADVRGLINLRGQIATVVDLYQRLGFTDHDSACSDAGANGDRSGYHIVVRTKDEIVSLWVAQIGDILQLRSSQFERPPATLQGRMRQYLQGAYQLPEGFLLVLDTEKVLSVVSSLFI